MSDVYVSEAVKYVGVDDKTIDLFESQYLVPNGVSYNSYIIMDEKIAIMDTVDRRGTEEWLANVERTLDGKTPDYLVVQHMEPDHAGSIKILAEKYPSMQIVANAKTFPMMHNFFDMDLSGREVVVKEMDTLSLGSHTLTFVMAPMVHWPEVMVTYESSEKILFAADGFGKFGALDTDEDWICEARRYFINIVGKHGRSVQELLKKAATLDIAMICPLHGPVLKENLGYYLEKYDIWSSYRPEDKGIVVAYASIHGHTKAAVQELVQMLEEMGQKVVAFDLARCDMAEAVEDAYRYDRLIVACPTYDASIFPCMHDFLYHLQIKNFQKRTVGIIENGSWSPSAGRKMKAMLEDMRELKILEPMVTIKSSLKEESRARMRELAKAMAEA
ncbi:MAG: FprA family A-type flavoprotein [Lachnospiraceae bacterium]|nr:FprA family A-type flavoprotein [Lachnospiraceae bacterium]